MIIVNLFYNNLRNGDTMKQEVLTALKESIKHWEENEKAENVSEINVCGDGCALCAMFYDDDATDSVCSGCPVKNATGFYSCEYSPYENARNAYWAWDCAPDNVAYRTLFKIAAREEIDFLKSLLPVK